VQCLLPHLPAKEFYCNTYFQHHSRPYLTREFFNELYKKIPDRLLIIIAKSNKKNIAAAFNIIDNNTLYGRYWGAIEYIPNLHFELCYYQGQEYCIENNLQFFEGGAQGEHKLARGFEPFETYSCHYIADERFREAIKEFLQRESVQMECYTNELDCRKPFKKIN
jgi:predicted N-acyltransferase